MKRATLAIALVLATGSFTGAGAQTPGATPSSGASPGSPSVRPKKPDIYYIVLDRYGAAPILKKDFGYDNEPFLNWLRSKGFYVADRGRDNYPRTSHSIASTLNMRFLDGLAPPTVSNYAPVYKLLKGPKVARFLKARGYKYIKLGSWWKATSSDPLADKNYKFQRPDKVTLYAAQHGLSIRERFYITEYFHRYWQYRQLREVIPKIDGPKFVWAHILCPHEPWVVDRHGHFTAKSKKARAFFKHSHTIHHTNPENYVEQVRWTNTQLVKLVNSLLKGPEESRPVVVIQADEGPYTGLVPQNATRVSIKKLKQKMFVLSTLYLPGVRKPPLYQSFSSVNDFRLIFNLYFGTHYALLPDRSYVYIYKDLYRFLDVTDLVTH